MGRIEECRRFAQHNNCQDSYPAGFAESGHGTLSEHTHELIDKRICAYALSG